MKLLDVALVATALVFNTFCFQVGAIKEVGRALSTSRRQKCAKAAIIVCNRGSGTISILDARRGKVKDTITLPGKQPEPMYVVALFGKVWVNDRANNVVVVYDAEQEYKLLRRIPIGLGAFHMCPDQSGRFLWVVCDIDKTIVVIDMVAMTPVKTIPIPQRLADEGGKPHDLTVTWDGRFVFVTVVGLASSPKRRIQDAVLKYDGETFELVASRTDLEPDPHVTVTWRNNVLYTPQQGGNILSFLSQDDLTEVADSVTIPDAHGTLMFSADDTVMYVTDIAPGDNDSVGIYAVDIKTNEILGSVTEGVPATPHNVAGTGDRFFLTHSGETNDLVTMWTYSLENPIPVRARTVTVGLNPFGLDYLESTCPDEA